MLVARDLSKEYRSGDNRLAVLRDVSFSIPQGAFVAVVGPSGSGKTTLLGLLAGLDTPSRGAVLLDDADLTAMDEDQRARLRGQKVGFVFQSFQLIAIARAFANSPRILFADEPTGNLDSETGAHIVELLESLNRESKTTIILVTHDLTVASRAQRIIRLSDGRVVSDTATERAA